MDEFAFLYALGSYNSSSLSTTIPLNPSALQNYAENEKSSARFRSAAYAQPTTRAAQATDSRLSRPLAL
jgi:hypothetical protein